VAALIGQMPAGAISNPIRVPGGISIISLRGKRDVGRDMETMLSMRQAFLPFTAPLNPTAPTDQQKHQLEAAKALQASARSCDAIDAANKAAGATRPSDPGDVRLAGLSPQMQQLLSSMQPNQASRPLVSPDGILIVMICSREDKNVALPSRTEISNRLLNERVELASRQLVRELRRRAVIDQRG
jgi:peptidyl-prolyl cis-trans isomerase SurA